MLLVERDPFLATLNDALADLMRRRRGANLLLAGEAGIGKTALLRAFAHHRPPGSALWWGQCDALQTAHPLAPLLDVARSADVRFGRCLDPATPRSALFEAVLDDLRLAALPTVFVIEDAHWADDATLDLVRFLARRIDRLPALLVVSYRDDEVPPAHPLRRVVGEMPATRRITLPRLTPDGVAALAQGAQRSAAGLYDVTHGNPFFVTELLLQGEGEAVPDTVQAAVLARFARLPAAAQAIVRLAAVVPGRIERWLVDGLLAPPLDALEACLAVGLLQADGGWLRFRHELARVAVESSLSPLAAQALHGQVLAAFERHPERQAEVSAARRVHHATRAGDAAAVRHWAPVAAEEARARGAHGEAAAHWRVALADTAGLDGATHARWLEACAVECQTTDRLEDAMACRRALDTLLHAAGDPHREAVNQSHLALVLVLALRNADADAAAARAIALLEAQPPGAELAHAYWVDAQLRMLNRECERSAARARQAIDLAARFDNPQVLAAAHGTLGASTLFIDWERGLPHLHEALRLAQAHGFDWITANSLVNIGSSAGELYRLPEADHWLREAVAYANAREIDFYHHYALAWLALTDLYAGRWDDAATRAAEAERRSARATTGRVMALVALGRLRTRRGDPGHQEVLDEALQLAQATGTLQRLAPVHAARAEAAFMRGDRAAAAAEARAALPLAVARGHRWHAGEFAVWLARCGEAVEPPPACAEPHAHALAGRWREAADAWAALGCPYEAAQARAEGDADAQREALDQFERLGARPAAEALRRRLQAAGVRGLPRGARASTQEQPFGLTRREREVLELLCEGLRNAEIAERLHRSVRTVDHHLAAAYAKLGVDSRLDAVRQAQAAGIGPQIGQPGAPI